MIFIMEKLQELGVDIDEALERFMGDESFFIEMLGKFEKTVEENPVAEYFEAKDFEKALKSAHTLKGVTGNFSMTPLYNGYFRIVELLRAGDAPKAEEILRDILPLQDKIISCINELE